jgi:hypothetical protein
MKKRINGPDPRVLLASGEFDRRREAGCAQPSMLQCAKKFNVTVRAVRNYRANHVSRRGRWVSRESKMHGATGEISRRALEFRNRTADNSPAKGWSRNPSLFESPHY